MNKIIHFTLNGDPVEALAPVNMTMVDFLRKEMHLTGTKRGCEEGECGACTILLDGRAVPSCIMLAVEADGHEITTIEGVRKNGVLHPVQQEFMDKWALQCGFCTPRHDHVRAQPAQRKTQPHRRGNTRRHRRQPVPLHRLCQDRRSYRLCRKEAGKGKGG